MNWELKTAIMKSGKKGYEVEREAKLPYTKLPKIIHGYITPTFQEKERLAVVLGKSVQTLFPEKLPVETA